MADPTFKLCDVCGERCAADSRVYAHVGWSPCAAGGPRDRDVEIIDLCEKHLASAVNVFLADRTTSEEHGKKLVEWVKQARDKARKK